MNILIFSNHNHYEYKNKNYDVGKRTGEIKSPSHPFIHFWNNHSRIAPVEIDNAPNVFVRICFHLNYFYFKCKDILLNSFLPFSSNFPAVINTYKTKKIMDTPLMLVAILIAVTLVSLLIILLVKQNKTDSFHRETQPSSSAMGKGMGLGMAIGMGTGVAMGASMENIGVGIAIGAGIGVSLGVAFGTAFKKKEEEERQLNKGNLSHVQGNSKRLTTIFGILAVLIGLTILGLMLFMKMN